MVDSTVALSACSSGPKLYGAVDGVDATADAHIDVAVLRETSSMAASDASARSHRKIVGALFLAAAVVSEVQHGVSFGVCLNAPHSCCALNTPHHTPPILANTVFDIKVGGVAWLSPTGSSATVSSATVPAATNDGDQPAPASETGGFGDTKNSSSRGAFDVQVQNQWDIVSNVTYDSR